MKRIKMEGEPATTLCLALNEITNALATYLGTVGLREIVLDERTALSFGLAPGQHAEIMTAAGMIRVRTILEGDLAKAFTAEIAAFVQGDGTDPQRMAIADAIREGRKTL